MSVQNSLWVVEDADPYKTAPGWCEIHKRNGQDRSLRYHLGCVPVVGFTNSFILLGFYTKSAPKSEQIEGNYTLSIQIFVEIVKKLFFLG